VLRDRTERGQGLPVAGDSQRLLKPGAAEGGWPDGIPLRVEIAAAHENIGLGKPISVSWGKCHCAGPFRSRVALVVQSRAAARRMQARAALRCGDPPHGGITGPG
jgi:hypothetical protein